jgi:1,2-diacylglycerol 3-beta-galactosyltransferase
MIFQVVWHAAADVVVSSKAGPAGTIVEAASLGLLISLLTSFLPGQEAGNVKCVTESGFGVFREDP